VEFSMYEVSIRSRRRISAWIDRDGAVAAGGHDEAALGWDLGGVALDVAGEACTSERSMGDERHRSASESVEQDGQQHAGEPAGAALDRRDP
jgi:hypothetical protein